MNRPKNRCFVRKLNLSRSKSQRMIVHRILSQQVTTWTQRWWLCSVKRPRARREKVKPLLLNQLLRLKILKVTRLTPIKVRPFQKSPKRRGTNKTGNKCWSSSRRCGSLKPNRLDVVTKLLELQTNPSNRPSWTTNYLNNVFTNIELICWLFTSVNSFSSEMVVSQIIKWEAL